MIINGCIEAIRVEPHFIPREHIALPRLNP
jgi:hypothetical protein